MKEKGDSRRCARQRGFTAIEVLTASAVGMVLLGFSGYMVKRQMRSYRDLDATVKLQTDAKKAVEHMTREISNSGGLITEANRPGFQIHGDRIQLAYVDLRARYCKSTETAGITFRVRAVDGGNALVQEIRCNAGATKSKTLVKNPGPIRLAFTYFDLAGNPTNSRISVQRVRFSLDLVSPKGRSLFQKSRRPEVDVDLTNY